MKHPKFQLWMYAAAGIVLAFFVIFCLNFIFGQVRIRWDSTGDKIHTLSPGTRKILARLESPVEIRLYVTQDSDRTPPEYKTHMRNVEDMLQEFRAAAKGNLEIKKFDPEPDSEAEEAARLDGVEPQPSRTGESFYLGVVASLDPQKVALPFLSLEREKLLEYDLARAITQVMSTNKPVVGVMSPLPIFGTQSNPMMARMGMQRQDPWVVVTELKADFTVEQVPMDTDSIDEKIKVLMVVHPKDITDKAQFAIDQFVLRGGKLIAFLDSHCYSDNSQPNQMGINFGGTSTLPKLLKTWGLEFDTTKCVADLTFAREIQTGDGRQQFIPTFLFINQDGVNATDPVTAQSDNLLFPFAGVFTGKEADGLKKDVLLRTTTKSQLVDAMSSQFGAEKIAEEFKPSNTQYALAVRLTGKFKSAFPDGKPADPKAADKTDADKKEEKKEEKKGDYLKESTGSPVVYLFGDADFLANQFSVQINPFFHIATPVNGNLTLVQNLVDQAAGDANLVEARARASIRRPFKRVQEMEAAARLRFQSELEMNAKKQQEIGEKLREVQVKREGNTARIILTPEQQQAIKDLERQQIEQKKKGREIKKELRHDVESLENRLKWANIGLMPALVSVFGIVLAVVRRNRTAAK
jgi:ABC-type uncharacterized transport system involved in gliding motility auxiliary subunit